MRIRKNAKKLLSSLLGLGLTETETAREGPEESESQSHSHAVCQLNQSPWDVITFASHEEDSDYESPSPSRDHHQQQQQQLEDDNNFMGYVAAGPEGEGIGIGRGNAINRYIEDDNNTAGPEIKHEARTGTGSDDVIGEGLGGATVKGCCKRTNGKGWQCSREVKEGKFLCDHHSKSKSKSKSKYSSRDSTSGVESVQLPKKVGCSARRGRPPKPKRDADTPALSTEKTNESNQYYYYSGFGPSWRRRRAEGQRGGGRGVVEAEGEESSGSSGGVGVAGSGDEKDEVVTYGVEEENGESGGGGGRKRTRKPVKARSLKSLM